MFTIDITDKFRGSQSATFKAAYDGDLGLMFDAEADVGSRGHPENRLVLLERIVAEAFKRRTDDDWRTQCIHYATKFLVEFDGIYFAIDTEPR